MPAPDKVKRRLTKIMSRPENETCVECQEPTPTWAILVNPPIDSAPVVVAFTCYQCASALRSLGTHILRVKSCHLDECKCYSIFPSVHLDSANFACLFLVVAGSEEDLALADHTGNKRVNAIFEANHKDAQSCKPTPSADLDSRKIYVKDKYEQRLFFDPMGYSDKSMVGMKSKGCFHNKHLDDSLFEVAQQSTAELLDAVRTESSFSSRNSTTDTAVAQIQEVEESVRSKSSKQKVESRKKENEQAANKSPREDLFGKAVGKTLSKRRKNKSEIERPVKEESLPFEVEEEDLRTESSRNSSFKVPSTRTLTSRSSSTHDTQSHSDLTSGDDRTTSVKKKKKKKKDVNVDGKRQPKSPRGKRSKSLKIDPGNAKPEETKPEKDSSVTLSEYGSMPLADASPTMPRKSSLSNKKRTTERANENESELSSSRREESLSSFKEGVEDLSKQNIARRSRRGRPGSDHRGPRESSAHNMQERESRRQSRRRTLRACTSPGALGRHSTGSLGVHTRKGRSASPGSMRGRIHNRRSIRQQSNDELDANRMVQEGLFLVQQGLALQEQAAPHDGLRRTSSSGQLSTRSPRSGRNLRTGARTGHHRSPTTPHGDHVDGRHVLDGFTSAPPLVDVGTPLTRRLQRRMSLERIAGMQQSPL